MGTKLGYSAEKLAEKADGRQVSVDDYVEYLRAARRRKRRKRKPRDPD